MLLSPSNNKSAFYGDAWAPAYKILRYALEMWNQILGKCYLQINSLWYAINIDQCFKDEEMALLLLWESYELRDHERK